MLISSDSLTTIGMIEKIRASVRSSPRVTFASCDHNDGGGFASSQPDLAPCMKRPCLYIFLAMYLIRRQSAPSFAVSLNRANVVKASFNRKVSLPNSADNSLSGHRLDLERSFFKNNIVTA